MVSLFRKVCIVLLHDLGPRHHRLSYSAYQKLIFQPQLAAYEHGRNFYDTAHKLNLHVKPAQLTGKPDKVDTQG